MIMFFFLGGGALNAFETRFSIADTKVPHMCLKGALSVINDQRLLHWFYNGIQNCSKGALRISEGVS